MKIAVVGPGAVGCLFAGMLRTAGNEVLLCTRTERQADILRTQGIYIEKDNTVRHILLPAHAVHDPAIGPETRIEAQLEANEMEDAIRVRIAAG